MMPLSIQSAHRRRPGGLLPLLCALLPVLWVLLPLDARAEDTTYRNQMRTARRLVARHQPEEALQILETIFRKIPYESRAASLYVDALLQLDRTQEAKDFLAEALAQPKADALVLHRSRVNVYLATEEWDRALADIVQTMVLGDDLTDWSFKTSHMLVRNGLAPGSARKIVEKAQAEAPENTDLTLLDASMMTLDGDAPKALERVTQADRGHKEQGRLLLSYADRLVELEHRPEARLAIEAAAQEAVKPSRRSEVLFRLADFLQEDKDYEAALVPLATIAEERDGTAAGTKALMESADIYREFVKDCDRALEVYNRLEKDPAVGHYLPELLLDKADCQIRLQEFDAAMQTYDRVFPEALDPEHAEQAAYGKANAMFFAGDPDSAQTLFQDMAQAYPRSMRTDDAAQYYILLNAYASLGGGEAMTLMGRMEWGVTVEDSSVTAEAAQDLVNTYPRSEPAAEALMVLAALAESSAHHAQALGYYEQVVQDHPQDRRAPLALKKQGDLLVSLQRPQEALEKLERILTDYPNSVVAGETRRMVEKLRSAIKS